MKFKNILIEIDEPLAVIIINRPKKLNALNKETIQELHDAFKMLDENPKIKAIILSGSGDKAFVAGADIAEFAHYDAKKGKKLAQKGQELLFNYVENLNTPVIAAINGFALGGGLELAMACHFRLSSEQSKMGLPEVSLGVIPGYGGTQRLPNLVGKGKAMEMILSAGMIPASEALKWGLVNYVVEQEELMPLAMKIAGKLSNNSPVAIKYAIKAINAGFNNNAAGYKTEIDAFGKCFGTSDFKEGTTAFLEKRKADFPGA